MNKADRNLLISIGVIAVIFIGGYASLVAYTGFSTPFSIVMSQSMQHDPHQSEIGSIDTGDIVIVMDPSKADIQSYIDGTKSGYTSFGDYGSVIIYNRGDNQNPVIHRAIIWLEYNPVNDTWSAPSLNGYDGSWYCQYFDESGNPHTNENDYNNLRGTLYFEDITASGKDVHINLDNLEKKSGFLTMGDNPETNTTFDQTSSIIDHPIGYDDIRSVPVFEIPWLGTIKILLNGGRNLEDVPNSLPSLVMLFMTVFGLLFLIDALTLYRNRQALREELRKSYQWKR